MRKATLPLALLLVALAAPPALGDSSVNVANFSFSPGGVSIHKGEKVTWRWTGGDKNHTVTSDPGQAESFESHPGVATPLVTDGPSGETFSHTFSHTGTFSYTCRVHPSMTGTVSVVAPGAPLKDTKAPVTTLKIRRVTPRSAARSGRIKVKVTVDEAATETVVARLGRRRIARKTVKFLSAGTKTIRLKLNRRGRRALRRRRRAKIRVRATAVDAAGNKKVKRASITLGSRPSSGSPNPY
jgi:plastocyanin